MFFHIPHCIWVQLHILQLLFHQCWLIQIFARYFLPVLKTYILQLYHVNENHIRRIPFSLGNKIHLQELRMDCSSKNVLALKGYTGTCPNQWFSYQFRHHRFSLNWCTWRPRQNAFIATSSSGEAFNIKKKMLFLLTVLFQTPLLAAASQSDTSEIVMNSDHSTDQEMSGYSPESSLSPPPPLQRVMDPGISSYVLFSAIL